MTTETSPQESEYITMARNALRDMDESQLRPGIDHTFDQAMRYANKIRPGGYPSAQLCLITTINAFDRATVELEAARAELKKLRAACDGVPELIEAMTETIVFDQEGRESIEWENARYLIAQNLRLAMRYQYQKEGNGAA